MKSSRSRLSALFAVVAMLFSQLAVSAYACPGVDAMARVAEVSQPAPPCHEQPTNEAVTPLCQAHCQQGDQSSDVRVASLPAFAFVALPSGLPGLTELRSAPAIQAQPSLLQRPTGPPLAIRHCCFRV